MAAAGCFLPFLKVTEATVDGSSWWRSTIFHVILHLLFDKFYQGSFVISQTFMLSPAFSAAAKGRILESAWGL